MIKKINFKKFSITIILSLVIVFSLTRLVWGWTNPTANPSSGAGAISVSSGNVGIGTASPGAKLHVSGGGILLDNAQYIHWKDASGTARTVMGYDSSNVLIVNQNGNFNTSLNPYGGNVGVGTASPATKLHLFGATSDTYLAVGVGATGKAGIILDSANGDVAGSDYYTIVHDRTSNTLQAGYAGAGTLTINSTGKIGIGTATADANYKITTTGGGIKAENSSASQPAGYFSNAGGGPALQIGTGGFVTETRTSDPASPVAGQIWLRTDL